MPDFEEPEGPAPEPQPDTEDLAFEITFYEGVLERLPDSVDVLMALGNNYTQCGFFEKGLSIDERLCKLRQTDPIVHYNLACSYALVGKTDKAIDALQAAINRGYRNFAYIQRDPDLQSLRCDPRYMALVKSLMAQKLTS